MTYEKLIEIADEYLQNNISIGDLACNYGSSKTELIRYFKGQKEIILPYEMQKKVDFMKMKRFKKSKSTSGNKGHFSLSQTTIKELALLYINEKDLDLRDISSFNKVSVATIYNMFTLENLGEELYNKVKEKYIAMHHSGDSKKGI